MSIPPAQQKAQRARCLARSALAIIWQPPLRKQRSKRTTPAVLAADPCAWYYEKCELVANSTFNLSPPKHIGVGVVTVAHSGSDHLGVFSNGHTRRGARPVYRITVTPLSATKHPTHIQPVQLPSVHQPFILDTGIRPLLAAEPSGARSVGRLVLDPPAVSGAHTDATLTRPHTMRHPLPPMHTHTSHTRFLIQHLPPNCARDAGQ
jgi:hypothetical protein